MRAFVVTAPNVGSIELVPDPVAGPQDVVVDVDIVGLCGTDVEIFRGTMPYFARGLAWFPTRPGHEWTGTIRELGAGVTDFAIGDRVIGDTFICCDVCERCLGGQRWLCPNHEEVGVRGGRDGALAERLAVPTKILYRVPAGMSASAAMFVEPGSTSMRGIRKAQVGPGTTTLIWGAGTIGLLAALFARAKGGLVTVVDRSPAQAELARTLGFECVASLADLDGRRFEAVIEATGSTAVPDQALATVAPGGRLVLIGVPEGPVTIDLARVLLEDVTVLGVLGGSDGIEETLEVLASGSIDVDLLVARRVGLDEVPDLLAAGLRVPGMTAPKIQVVPSIR